MNVYALSEQIYDAYRVIISDGEEPRHFIVMAQTDEEFKEAKKAMENYVVKEFGFIGKIPVTASQLSADGTSWVNVALKFPMGTRLWCFRKRDKSEELR